MSPSRPSAAPRCSRSRKLKWSTSASIEPARNSSRCRCYRGREEVGGDRSDHFNRVAREPDVELLESIFELLLVFDEELPVLGQIRNVDKQATKFVRVLFALLLPKSPDDLRFARQGVELRA